MAPEAADMSLVRTGLADTASAVLLGPLQADEVLESAPGDTYLTGILWPRGTRMDASDDDDSSSGDNESASDASIPGYRAVRPCSIGMTFAIRPGSAVTVSLGSTSRYEPVEVLQPSGDASPTRDSKHLASSRRWARRELGYSVMLKAGAASSSATVHEFTGPDGQPLVDLKIGLHVRRRVGDVQEVITLTLINEETDQDESRPRDVGCLFQTEIVVRGASPTSAVIQPRPAPPPSGSDADALSNALLYRNVREFAVGHGVAATWSDDAGDTASEARTSWLPRAIVRGTSTEGHRRLKEFRDGNPEALSAAFLGNEAAQAKVVAALTEFACSYGVWIEEELRSRIGSFEGSLHDAAAANLQRCASTFDRILSGVAVLRTDQAAWTAFALANAAMDRQARFPSRGASPRPLVWRPFQLAFMLLVIPGLVNPDSEDRNCMDLLWFPTGGGKTEAYLALAAFQIFHRRLTDAPRRERGGVDVLMRYTLRLLTVQQFQRAAALIVACDLMRASDTRLGDARISLGLYVGGEATPNSMEDARKAIAQEIGEQKPRSTPKQLLRCPVCGRELRGADYGADPLIPRIDIVCASTACETAGQPLPVLTVDEAIYSTPPSLLIGTIDKFAQIPRRGDIRRIFGLDGGSPPSLIIQDELHLISGPLGSMAGLYESVVDTLCSRDSVRPKIIGSTATIGRAEAQVRALFDRSVLQFPPPGFDADDSFFAVLDTSGPDRTYVGIPTAGRSPKFALQAVVASLLQSASALRQSGKASDAEIDPYWTCVSYFNSLRELGGAYVLMQDDVPRQMQFLARRLAVSKRELQNLPVELSSRRSSRELPELLHALAGTLQQFREDPFEHPEPKDTVLASNMISVGVDVPRLGLMVVNGQPKSTAEYIQASSRVGRGIPGLVFTLYNFGRPRDLSHFEHFMSYHAALYRNVEATSVTPWAPRARDKALHAVVVSLVRHLVPGLVDDDGATDFRATDPAVTAILELIKARVAGAADPSEAEDAASELDSIVEEWARRAHEARDDSGELRYWGGKALFGRTVPHLLCSAEDAMPAGVQAWATPNTMREVEPSTAFVLRNK